LTFASVSPQILHANVKSKTTLEFDVCWCPFGSDIRKGARCDTARMSEPGHQRVPSAPGIPHALCCQGAKEFSHSPGAISAAEGAGVCVIVRENWLSEKWDRLRREIHFASE
jgi:hypothetical protein